VKKEEKETKSRYGIVNFEKRRYPRYNVNLPIEYARSDSVFHGEAFDASEDGLLVYFAERVEVGQHLSLKLFFLPCPNSLPSKHWSRSFGWMFTWAKIEGIIGLE
jgi:hypothetical protein